MANSQVVHTKMHTAGKECPDLGPPEGVKMSGSTPIIRSILVSPSVIKIGGLSLFLGLFRAFGVERENSKRKEKFQI